MRKNVYEHSATVNKGPIEEVTESLHARPFYVL